MAGHPNDRTTGDESDPADVTRTAPPTGASKEPLVSGDPLGLGGSPEPDAPSRRPRPRVWALAGEFLRMSRTTAILLASFVVIGAVYLMIRDDPVATFGPPMPSPTVATEGPSPTGSTEPTATPTSPTTSTSGATTSPSRATSSPSGATSTTDVPAVPMDDDEGAARPSGNSVPASPSSTGRDSAGAGGAEPTGAGTPNGQQGGGVEGGGATSGTQ